MVSQGRGRWRPPGFAGLAFAACLWVPASAHGAIPRDEQIREMVAALMSAGTVEYEHAAARLVRAPFGTARPCRIRIEEGRIRAKLERRWVEPLAEAVRVRRLGSLARPYAVGACPKDSTRMDQVSLVFGEGNAAVRLTPSLDEGICHFAHGSSYATAPIDSGAAEIVRLLSSAVPTDSFLSRIRSCGREADSLQRKQRDAAGRGPGAPADSDAAETLPEAIEKIAPVYPEDANRAGVDGTVLVLALVGQDGRVRETIVRESIPLLDAEAVRAVENWRFKPARVGTRPVAVWVGIPVRFQKH
jgi:protein TonB